MIHTSVHEYIQRKKQVKFMLKHTHTSAFKCIVSSAILCILLDNSGTETF